MEYDSGFYKKEIFRFIRNKQELCEAQKKESLKLKSILEHFEFLFREYEEQIKKENKK